MSNAKQMRGYYAENPTKFRRRSREYYHANSEAQRAKKAAQYAANPQLAVDRCRAFRAKNPNYFREYGARKRFRRAWLAWTTQLAASRIGREIPHHAEQS